MGVNPSYLAILTPCSLSVVIGIIVVIISVVGIEQSAKSLIFLIKLSSIMHKVHN